MIDRQHIEKILQMNGIEPGAPDEQIKEILIRARWHEDDVETALIVLREDPEKKSTHVETMHKVFNTNEKLSPDTLNAILGIDVEINDVVNRHRSTLQRLYRRQIVSLVVLSALFALAFIIFAMSYLDMEVSVFGK